MKKTLLAASCLFLLGGLGVRSASAATFDFSFTGVDTGSGTFTASPVSGSPGVYQVTTITGTISGPSFGTQSILGLLPPDTFPQPAIPSSSNFNYLYYPQTIPAVDPSYQTQPSFLDINGISFYLGTTGDCSLNNPFTGCFNLYYGSDSGDPLANPSLTGYNLFYPDSTANDLLDSFSVTLVGAPPTAGTPEPSSLVLLGTGAAGVLGAARRKLKRS